MITTDALAPSAVSVATSGAIFAATSAGFVPAAADHASMASNAPINRRAKLTATRGSKNPRDESPFMKPGIVRRQVQISSARKLPQPRCRCQTAPWKAGGTSGEESWRLAFLFHVCANKIRHCFLPRPWRDARQRFVFRRREHAVDRSLRDEAFHFRERRLPDLGRLQRDVFRSEE